MIARKTGLRLLDVARMPYRLATDDDLDFGRYPYAWNGKLLLVTPSRTGTDLVHELCHWLFATPAQRQRREFGLGAAPWADLTSPRMWCPSERQYRIEAAVSLLDVYVHKLFSGAWKLRSDALNMFSHKEPRDWRDFIYGDDGCYPAESNAALWKTVRCRSLPRRVETLVSRL